MTKRVINTNIEQHLVANEPFEYAHLIKFERPFDPKDGTFRTNARRYVYLTDGARDITFHGNTYIANRIKTVGAYSETVEAKATNMSLTLSGEPLGLSYTVTGNLSSGSFVGSGLEGAEPVDFVSAGFIEGDKVKVSIASGANFSDGDSEKKFIITAFSNDNKTLTLVRTGTDSDDSAFVSLSSTALKFELDSEEILSATLDSGGTTPSFLNREVFIYKVFFDPDDLTTPIGAGSPSSEVDNSVLVFKGIISSTNIQETGSSSKVQWNLTSHWGDFEQISGRITTDEIHRALDNKGRPNPNATARPLHATDLGFLHAETSLNTVATYQTSETRYKYKVKKKWYGKVKMKEVPYTHIEDHDVDLNVYLSGKYLPVVYGVQRLPGIPVFADTLSTNAKEIYVAYAISEGENHAVYNMYIDGAPLLCVDSADATARGVSAANSQNEALQCYGRMDRGDTLGGDKLTGTTTYSSSNEDYGYYDSEEEDYDRGYDEYYGQTNNDYYYTSVSEPAASSNTLSTNVSNAAGLQHEETASINHPYDLHFTFHSGRHDQKVNNILATKAASNSFLRQTNYYESNDQYWGPNHRLLDTSYAVMKFTIDADATTIPEVEYVVKGKVLENYNYDGTYVHDGSLGASDNHANFKEGDTVSIEFSTNNPQDASRSWTALSGTFRILDKYNFTTSRGNSFFRFRLDSIPDLALDSNGIPTRKYIRLKSGSNYWHMMTWNADLVSTATAYPHTTNRITPNSMSTNGSVQLQAVLSNTEESRLQAFFGTTNLNNATSTPIYLAFSGSGFTGKFSNLPQSRIRATYDTSNNTLTFLQTNFTPNQTLSGTLYLQPADKHLFSFSNLTEAEADYYAVGSMLEIVETGEKREIINWTSGYATISSPFVTTPTGDHTFKITGKGRDLRASSNPAIQTMDLLTDKFYGKGLSEVTDINLDSVKASARICDSRSEVTLGISTATVKKGDIYKLVDGSGNHIASGKVKADSSGNIVTFEEVSGKFMRGYQDYLNYNVGDIVYHAVGTTTRYYRVTSGGFKSSAPVHISGTTNGLLFLSSVTLTKESGNASSPNTLTITEGSVPTYSLYDSDFVKYWRYLGWEENRQWCVTRHQTNGVIDTGKSVFNNINGMLSHYNGVLSYSNGKYVLGVETATNVATTTNTFNSVTYDWNVNPEYIDETDIIGRINLNDNSQKNSKNTVKGSIFDPQNNFGSRSITFYNSDFLKADRNVIKTGNINLPAVTSYYNARMTIEKFLMESRFSKEISFTVGPKGLLLKPGEVITLNYEPFGFINKRFRIKNLNYSTDCNVTIKATEYDDSMYLVSAQRAAKAHRANLSQREGVEIPNSPSSVQTTNTKPGVIRVTWNNATNYKEGSDFTQIWRATSQGSSGDITSHATLIATVDNTTEYNDSLGNAGDFYYWVRHVRDAPRKLDGAIVRLPGNFSTAIDAGVEGTAKTASAQLDVDITAAQIKFNSSGNLVGSSASDQDVTFTASLRNLTPDSNGVVFSIVNVDLSAQTTQKVYPLGNEAGAAASISDTSAPFKAVLDASTFTSTTDNKFLKVTVTSTEGDTFTEVIPITVTQDGSSGSVGVDAAAVSLTASADVIVYDANDPDDEFPSDQTIIFTATGLGTSGSNSPFSGTPTYTFSIDGGTEQAATTTTGTSSATFTLPDGNEPSANNTKTITVFLRDGSGGTLKASDSMSIFGIKSGSDALNAFLTNEAHTVIANSSGVVSSFTGASGTFKVKVGATDITTSCTFALVGGSATGGTATVTAAGSNAGDYNVSAMSADVCTAIIRATIPTSVSPTGAQITIDRTFTVTKSKAGADGTDGTKVALVYAYQRSASNVTSNPGGVTVSLSSGLITTSSLANGWSKTIPSGSNPLYVVAASAAGTGSTDNIAANEWSAPVILAQDGDDGAAGLNSATARIYQRSSSNSSSPTLPVGTTTYTFSSGDISFTTANGWQDTVPTSGGEYLWTSQATAASTGSSDTIAASEWAPGSLLASDGDDGQTGASVNIVFKRAVNAPATPGNSAGVPSGWNDSPPSGQNTLYAVNGTKAVGASVFTWGTVYQVEGSAVFEAAVYRKNNATQPSGGSFNFTNNTLTPPTNWSTSVPSLTANGDIVYLAVGLFSGSPNQTAATTTWSTPVKYAQRTDGDDGNKVALLRLYKQQSSTSGRPTAPVDSTYNFTNDTLTVGTTNTNNGWSTTAPAFTLGQTIWNCEVVLTGAPTATSVTVDWPTPEFYSPYFDLSPSCFKRSATDPGAPSSGTAKVPTGWSETIPSGSNPVWQTNGTGTLQANFTISYTWSSPTKLTGDDGTPGQSVKVIELFRMNDSTLGFSGSNNATNQTYANPTNGIESGWTLEQPEITASGQKVYMSRRTFTSDGASPQESSWSTPVIVAQREDGNNDPRSTIVFIYNPSSNTTGVTQPNNVLSSANTTPYNFETSSLTIGSGGTSGWQITRPSSTPYWTSSVLIVESAYDDAQSVTYSVAQRTGSIGPKDQIIPADFNGTLPASKGGTGATNLNALENSRVRINANGTLSYNNTTTGALDLDTLSGVTGFVSRVSAGLDQSGNLTGNIGTGGNQRTIAEIAGAIDNSGNIVPGKVPLDTAFLEVDSGEIKIKDGAVGATQLAGSIAYTGTITAGSGTTVAGLVGSGTDAASTVRIFAGQSLASRNNAPFRVTQGGEVNVTSININTDDGNNHKSVLLKPDHIGGVIFAVGDKANPTGAPMRAVATGSGASAETTIELQNVKIFKNDGTTLMFDSDGGFTDAAYTDIAANVGTSSTGSTVQTVEVTNLVNPFSNNDLDTTASGGLFYTDSENVITGGTIPTGKKISQKITLFGTTTLNFTITKSASMTGTDSNATTANNEVPDDVKMRLMHSTTSNLRNATEIAKFGTAFTTGFEKITSGTANANQYRTTSVTEDEPGFSFTLVQTQDEGAAAGGTFTATGSGNFSGSTSGTDHYFFLEVAGDDNGTPTSGANSVAFDASRTLRITTTSGAFVVDDDGGVQPSGNDPDVIGVTAGNLIDVTDTAGNTNAQSIRVDVDLSELSQSTSNTDGDEFVVLDSSGNEKRLVKGNINLSGFNNDLTSFGSGISVTGAIQATGDVIAFHSSDYRLKSNVSTIENALDKVDQMRGVEFDWNDKQDSWEGHDIGVIAQEVEKVIPEIVIERDDGYKAVSYHKLTALLIEAVKELKEEIKELKKDK